MKTLIVLVLLACARSTAFAQPAVAGDVRDRSGLALGGVTVEVSSPALIERLRSTVTDAAGRYRIDDLRPGVYVVTFTLDGWRPARRVGVELAGDFTTNVDAELAPAAFATAVTVTGDVPVVDVHSAKHGMTLSGELVRSIPTVRTYNALLVLVPGVVTNANDTVTATATVSFPIHGGRANEGRLLLDGLTVGSPPAGNSAASYVVDTGEMAEVTFTTSGSLGEHETAGVVMNLVPRTGGNDSHGSFSASASGSWLQAETSVRDLAGSFGGAISRDRAWYFLTAHSGGSRRTVPGVYYNQNAGDPSKWLYVPDGARPEYSDRTFDNASARVTWQLTPRHRLGAFWDAQSLCRACTGATPGLSEPQRISPEAVGVLGRPLHVTQVTWSSSIGSNVVVDAAYGGTFFGVGNFEREPNPTRDLIRVQEQCASGCAGNGNIPGLVYRSQDYSVADAGSYLWKATLSRVTGSRSLKIGYQHTLMTDDRTWYTNSQNLTYRFNNGVPNQLTQSISPWVNDTRVAWHGLFAQHRWTEDRLSVEAAVRFDRARSWFPPQQEGPSKFLPSAIVIPKTTGVDSYKDITPRIGASVDVFGDGRTALKAHAGRFLEGAGVIGNYANTNPSLRLPQTTMVFGTAGVTRTWIDANANFAPDCNLLNPGTQDLRPDGGDFCGVMSDTNFGRHVLANHFDPSILNGWGVRPGDWSLGLSIDHQILPRASIGVAYSRRSFSGFFAADNLALEPADLTPYHVVAPADPRLPGGGGYVVPGLYDVVPEKAGRVDNEIIGAERFGRWQQYFNGIDVTVDIRAAGGFSLAGGTSTGQTVTDNCDVRRRLPELSTATTGTSPFGAGLATSAVTPVSPYCHVASGLLTQVRGLSAYEVPRTGIQVSAAFQSKPGPMLAANYAVPNADVAPVLGRNLSGNVTNVTVNLVKPGTLYGDRVNQLDVRVTKRLRYGRARVTVGAEIYNALDSRAVLAYNNAFVPGGTWLQPMMMLTPRFMKVTGEVRF